MQYKRRIGTPVDIQALQQQKVEMKTKQVQEINESEFETEVLRCAQPVLVGFLTGWSKPSRLVEPVLDEVAEACNGNAKIFKVDVDDNPDLGTIYSIQSIPTLIYFVNGAVRAKIVGMVSPKAILAKLNSLTPKNTPTKEPEQPQ
jgi:thioredoxin 1